MQDANRVFTCDFNIWLKQMPDRIKNRIVYLSRQNERFRMPLHVNYYKWGKIDLRPYLHLFAGIGVEKLYLFYTHILHQVDIHYLSDGELCRLIRNINGVWVERPYVEIIDNIYTDMIMMVQDPRFVRKLRRLNQFTELDFKKVDNMIGGAMISIMKGQQELGFSRKTTLYIILDIALAVLEQPTAANDYNIFDRKKLDSLTDLLCFQIYRGDYPVEIRKQAFLQFYSHPVLSPGLEPLYELNFELLKQDRHMRYNSVLFRKAVLENVWMPPSDRVQVYVMEDEEGINIIFVDALNLDIHEEVDELDQNENLD